MRIYPLIHLYFLVSLLFIYFTNTYTKYKTSSFDNNIAYLFTLSVVCMQLLEYFLWKNLNNK